MGSLGMPYGFQALLKEGYKHFSESVQINIDACKDLAKLTRTSMGPDGMNKMVINHLDKIFVTSDASTIAAETEVVHPAAKLLVMAARAQEEEVGDGTNLVLSLAGELLAKAEELLRDGLHVTEIIDGYARAQAKALEVLDTLVLPGTEKCDMKDVQDVSRRLRGVIGSKMHGFEDVLGPLVAEACAMVCPANPFNFNVDNVRVCKLPGGALSGSKVVRGMVLKRSVEGAVKRVTAGKVAAFSHGVDTQTTETKGTVLIRSAEELQNYSKSEEVSLEAAVKAIAEQGVKVVVSGSSVGDMALHFLEQYEIMVLKIPSKFDLQRFCRATGTSPLASFKTPQATDIGYVEEMFVDEIGSQQVVVVRQQSEQGRLATIVLRGSTENILDEVERCLDDGVNAFRAMGRDSRMTAAGGATEISVARQVHEFAEAQAGLEQYPIKAYSQALEVVPRMLAENAGRNAQEVVTALYAAHAAGNANAGLDVDSGSPADLTEDGVMDLYSAKWWAIKLATEAVQTILKVDQIIMAKQAGGPKPKQGGDWDQD